MRPPRLVSVSGTAFGSFASPFELKLPETGLVLLRGENLDTKGSSASGKSTLIHAINYPLGTCPVPLTALQSWYTKESPRVTNTYDVDGKIVKISRGKRFELEIDGEPFRGSADQKEEKIDLLFGTDAEMRLALTYRGQRKPGLFLSKTDKKQKEFLTKLLNLDKWDEEQKKSLLKVKELEERAAVLNARIGDIAARLATLTSFGDGAEAEASLANIVKEIEEHQALQLKYEKTVRDMENDAKIVYDFALDLFKPKIAEAEARCLELEQLRVPKPPMTAEWTKLVAMRDAIEPRMSRLETEDHFKAKDHAATLNALGAQWQALAMQASGINKLLADRDRVIADMKALSKNCCPTCLREWEEAKARLEDLKEELQQIKGETEELEFVKEQANTLRAEIDGMPRTPEPNPLIAQMRAALKKCQEDIKAEEEKANAGMFAEIDQNRTNLEEARKIRDRLQEQAKAAASEERRKVIAGIDGLRILAAQEKDTKVKLELARQKLAEEVGASRERRRQIVEAEAKLAELSEDLAPLQIELAQERDFAHLTGREGFRGSVFDEALDAISEETNVMLASIANTRNCTLEFISESMTQDGKVRQEIVPVITINGHKTSLDYGPSGGMLSAIELAVDLAVGKHISERTGVCPGWLILDESFDGLGPREKETCLEILQLYARDRLVIIVDHMSETQGLFTHRITVRNQHGVSVLA